MTEGETTLVMMIIGFVVVMAVLMTAIVYEDIEPELIKNEAQKIIDFRQTEHTCNDLKRLYLKQEPDKYNSINNADWFRETKSKLVSDGCFTQDELNNMEFIHMCMDGRTTGCAIHKIENPELYEGFEYMKFDPYDGEDEKE